MRAVLRWGIAGLCAMLPFVLAMQSPLLAWRDPTYIMAGFAGVAAMGLLLFQVMLGAGAIGRPAPQQRYAHRLVGAAIAALVLVHIAGLWITSPPDVIDALLFRSPTPFAIWGVLAMWAVVLTSVLAILRRRMRFAIWRRAHLILAYVIVVGTVLHAVLIEGTMEVVSKYILSATLLLGLIFLTRAAQQKGRGKPRPRDRRANSA